MEADLAQLSTLVSKRADHLYCCESMFKVEEDKGILSPAEGTNPLSVVNVAKNILE
jgi:hypothetical protein